MVIYTSPLLFKLFSSQHTMTISDRSLEGSVVFLKQLSTLETRKIDICYDEKESYEVVGVTT